ncbi:MAG: ATP-binding cassette domain-containing protein [Candidatus Izemoplasmataceae bacterium]
MIKINSLNKFYNRNKKNELHVLNDVSLTFEDKGLIVLLGPSGSGKTTLLNVIGGMDNFHKGSIAFEEQIISKYSSKVWDDLRNEHIGMIFQNYYLLPQHSVYDNIALTLNMIGISDQEEIDKRIMFLLNAVNMGNYKNRKASQLSGGQQQRVAIARALAKNPKLILADEPTGNLDSKNTLEIMRIIKQISKEQLVIMVTHERKLANFFADRIIELEDGKIINDHKNTSNGTLDYAQETDIYLKDLTEHKTLSDDEVNIHFYQDTKQELAFNARLIVRNKTLYIDLNGFDIKKVVVLDEKSEVNIIDDTRKDLISASDETIKAFNYKEIIKDVPKSKKTFLFNPKQIFMQTISKLAEASRGSKLLYVGFAIGAMVVAYAVSSVFNIITVRDEEFLMHPRNSIEITDSNTNYETLLTLNTHSSIEGINLYQNSNQSTQNVNITTPFVYSNWAQFFSSSVPVTFAPNTFLSQRDIRFGRLPENPREVVVDEAWVRKVIFQNYDFSAIDLNDYEELLFLSLFITTGFNDRIEFDIVGISRTDTPVVYASEALMNQIALTSFHPLELFDESEISLVAGRMIESDYEVLMPVYEGFDPNIFTTHTFEMNNRDYSVVGVYEVTIDETLLDTDRLMMNLSTLKQDFYHQSTSNSRARIIYSSNVSETLAYLNSLDIEGVHLYAEARSEYLAVALYRSMGTLIFSGVSLIATALSFYFVIRSSMISRIYEIGVYRSLGTKRIDIIKRFILESAIITTFSSLIGFIGMTYIIYSTQKAAGDLFRIGHVSPLSILAGIAFIYFVNIVSGILPVTTLMRKTPAQINTQYDL